MVTAPPPDRPKAYSYIRMSTDIQLKGDSLRRQLEASRKYAEAHGLDLVTDVELHDIGVSAYSGKNIASGSFGRFLAAVREGKIEKGSYLLVESFDRMSRQEPIVALQPFMDIVNSGLKLVTLDDERVFSGKISFEDLIISIAKMSRANEESARKSDRLSKAWQNKRNMLGAKKLTARCPSWVRLRDDSQAFEIIEGRAAIVRRIFDEAVAGLGAYSIVRRLNADSVPTFTGKGGWQTSTVNKIIGSPAVIGTFQPGRMVNGRREPEGEPIRDYFPRILDDETFLSAQRGRLERRTTKSGDRKGSGGRKGLNYSNLFSKLAICAYCKQPMQFQNKGMPPKGQQYLVCSTALRGLDCPMKARWRYDHFETAFLSFVEKLDLASLVSTEKQHSQRAELTRQLEAAEGKQKKLEHEISLIFNTSKKLNDGSDFLARALKECEPEVAKAKEDQTVLRREIAKLDDAALTYYGNADQMADLIAQVRSSLGKDVYKIRAQIASRLQSIIKDLQLLLPLDDGDDQQFEANFRDGAHLMIFVDSSDPAKILRVIRAHEGLFTMTDGFGNFVDRYTMDEPSDVAGA